MSILQETHTAEDRKREIIRLVAESLQAENDRASDLELIVRKANISTAEVMEYFGSVNQLLMQMMTALADSLLRPLDDHPPPEASLETVLLAFGGNLANAYRNSYLTGLYSHCANGGHATHRRWFGEYRDTWKNSGEPQAPTEWSAIGVHGAKR